MTETRYKFLREVDGKIKSDNGKITWKIGKQKTHREELKLCQSGFHCSKEIQQAFSFVQGEVSAIVKCDGKYLKEDDKEVWQKMTIVKAYKWTKKDSVALAIYAAELVIDNYEKEYPNDQRPRNAIKAAKKWLKSPTDKNQAAAGAAWLAARSAGATAGAVWLAKGAARSAAGAARSAAGAAGSAAESAAGAAVWSADSGRLAGAAVWSAICKKIEKFMVNRIKKLEEIKDIK